MRGICDIRWCPSLALRECENDNPKATSVPPVHLDGQGGKPSVSRLQMLIWNFVVAFSFLYIVGHEAKFSEGIGKLLTP